MFWEHSNRERETQTNWRAGTTNSLLRGLGVDAEIVAWCTSSPIYFASFIGVLLPVGIDANDQT
jgi:hypothetical protein